MKKCVDFEGKDKYKREYKMFDRIINDGTRFPSKLEINEKRAPTDESIKLLREMEKKSQDNVLSRYIIDNNVLHVTLIEKQRDVCSSDRVYYVVFKLNHEEYKIRVSESDMDRKLMNDEQRIWLIFEKVAEEITYQLSMSIAMAVMEK